MKYIATVCCALSLMAGLCLAQSDSMQQIADTSAKSGCVMKDSSMNRCRDAEIKACARDRADCCKKHDSGKWVLGCLMNSLALNNFPGTVFLQKRITQRGFLGIGASYTYAHQGPDKNYSFNDSAVDKDDDLKWSGSFYPEYTVYKEMRGWLGSIAIRGVIQYEHDDEARTVSFNGDVSIYSNSKSTRWNFGFNFPVGLEKRFKIDNMVFSAGLQTDLLSISSSSYETITKTYHYHDPALPLPETTRHDYISPIRFSLYSPFNGSASIRLKYWF